MHLLVATAVPVERDAVARAFPGPGADVSRPGIALHRLPGGPDLLAAGVGPALAAASTAAALTA
ncbi:futalosine hydrolase, partial [Streptomyces diastaticus]|nr:futalosine hydrolase [Streptomyces diastaticus]